MALTEDLTGIGLVDLGPLFDQIYSLYVSFLILEVHFLSLNSTCYALWTLTKIWDSLTSAGYFEIYSSPSRALLISTLDFHWLWKFLLGAQQVSWRVTEVQMKLK